MTSVTRREMRIHLFELLFRLCDVAPEELEEQFKLCMDTISGIKEDDEATDKPYSDVALSASEELELKDKLKAVIAVLPELDSKIEAASKNWKLSRMNSVDLNILRVAAFEIYHDTDIPNEGAINEAVEIAKIYGGEQSYSFVNGILGRLIKNE